MKKQSGITLIALVITIVVLLILAGVSISMILGNNSIIGKAKEAKNSTNEATIKEYISTALVSTDTEYLVNHSESEETAYYTEEGSTYFGNEVKKSGATSGTITEYTKSEDGPITVKGTMIMNGTTYNWTAENGEITLVK